MTSAEKAELQSAVRMLMDGDDADWDDAMRILLRLAGMNRPLYDALDNADSIQVHEAIGRAMDR